MRLFIFITLLFIFHSCTHKENRQLQKTIEEFKQDSSVTEIDTHTKLVGIYKTIEARKNEFTLTPILSDISYRKSCLIMSSICSLT